MAVLGYLTKFLKGLGLAFIAHFLHAFSLKNCSLFNILSMDKVSMSSFFLLKISNKMCYEVLIWTVNGVKIYLRSTLKQWLTGGKRGIQMKN